MSIASRLASVEEFVRGIGNAVRLQGRRMSATAPTDKQVVMWNATTKKWEPVTGAQILIARATSNLTLTTSAQSIVGDGDSTKVRLILPTVGDWLVVATCDFVISATGTDGLIGELEVDDSGSAETGFAILDDKGNDIGATVSQRWKVTTTTADTPVELKARKATAAGTGTAHQPHTVLVAAIGIGGGSGGGASAHGDLTGVTSAQHHTKYLDADAIAAVPFIEYIPFGSEPITGQSYAP